jgi:EAL domain-containing protein (putative c-di-GMP-specific phosphodiesterase class I)
MSGHEFIAVAEETGLILPLGKWALRQACQQLNHWRNGGFPNLRMAVNLSPRQFYQRNFQDSVAGIINAAEVPADALELEITESLLVQPSEDNLATLQWLNSIGIQLAVDDFGMGYSSLAYLQRYPIRTLKIDRLFVNGIGQDPHDTAIVTAIIAMAQNLHLKVIAEGVETLQQVNFLKERGCLAAQGFYYSEAVPADTFTELLRVQTASALGS